jgi:hypothetical protein
MGSSDLIEVNTEPTPLTEEGISDYIIQAKPDKFYQKSSRK